MGGDFKGHKMRKVGEDQRLANFSAVDLLILSFFSKKIILLTLYCSGGLLCLCSWICCVLLRAISLFFDLCYM